VPDRVRRTGEQSGLNRETDEGSRDLYARVSSDQLKEKTIVSKTAVKITVELACLI
jgi:hypothetical protein